MRSILVSNRPPTILFVLTVLATVGMVWHYYDFFLPQVTARQHIPASVRQRPYLGIDLYQCWIGARELFHSRTSPYSDEITRQTQTELYGRPIDHARPGDPTDEHRFPYPLYMVFLMAPFSPLPFEVVRNGSIALWIAFALATFVLWAKSFAPQLSRLWLLTGAMLVLTSYPVLEAIFAEQLALLVATLLAAGILAIRRGDLIFAGAVVALATIKPQLVLLLAVYLAFWSLADWGRRKRLAYAGAAMMLLLVLGAEIMLPDWFMQWWQTVRAYRTYTLPPLAQYIFGPIAGKFLSGVLVLVTIWFGWKVRRADSASPQFLYAVAASLAITVLVFPSGDAVYDHVLLLPVILALVEIRQPEGAGTFISSSLGAIAIAAILWPYLSATAVVIWSFFDPAGAHREFFGLLPLRTTASIPFVLVALLGLRLRSLQMT